MEKTMKSVITVSCCAVLMAAWGLLPALSSAETLQDVENTWGKPSAVVKMENGAEKRFYKHLNTMDLGYRYFVIKDGNVIAKGTIASGELPSAPVAKANLPEDKLGVSKAYYTNHPTTVAEIEQVWGKPTAVKSLNNGKEERYYRYQTSMDIGYRAFLIQDGKVVASSIINSGVLPSAPVAQANLAEDKLGMSKAYYSNHPTTVAEIEQVWGKPAAVKSLSNGKEERYYNYLNSMDIGYRTFLIQDGKVIASGITRKQTR